MHSNSILYTTQEKQISLSFNIYPLSKTTGTVEVILRTSEDGHFPGFSAAVVCVNTALLQGLDDGGTSLPRIDGSGVSAKLDQFVRRCNYYIN